MKARKGFVSNSSSTSFTFAHKGKDIGELYDQIHKYNQYFDLHYYNCYDNKSLRIGAGDVVDAIQQCDIKERPDYCEPITFTIDEHIKDLKSHLERDKKYFQKVVKQMDANPEKAKNLNSCYSYALEQVFEAEKKIEDFEKLKEDRFTTVHVIGFGDNDGDVCGTDVGVVMDYEGRNIYINKHDFYVVTEQNRWK